MPGTPRYDDAEVIEKVVLPIANLRFALEALLDEQAAADSAQLIQGLKAVHSRVASIHDHLAYQTNRCDEVDATRRLPLKPGTVKSDHS